MVNLFIALFISDIEKLREEVFVENLINMAQYSIVHLMLVIPESIGRV